MSDSITCPHCQAAIQSGDRFCLACGASLQAANETAPPVATPKPEADTLPGSGQRTVLMILGVLAALAAGWWIVEKTSRKSSSITIAPSSESVGVAVSQPAVAPPPVPSTVEPAPQAAGGKAQIDALKEKLIQIGAAVAGFAVEYDRYPADLIELTSTSGKNSRGIPFLEHEQEDLIIADPATGKSGRVIYFGAKWTKNLTATSDPLLCTPFAVQLDQRLVLSGDRSVRLMTERELLPFFDQKPAADGPPERKKYAGTYRAVSESEWALEVTLHADGRATFKHELWIPGGYDSRKTTLIDGTWAITPADRLELRHGATSEIVQFSDALSFSEFGREGGAAGFKGIASATPPPAFIGRASLWRADALDRLFNSITAPPVPPPPVPLAARIFATESVFLGRLGGYRTEAGANSVNEQDHLQFAARQTNLQLIQNLVSKYQAQFDLQAAKGLAAAQNFYADASARLASYGIELGDAGSNLRERQAHLDWAQRQTPQKMREAIGEKVTVLLTGAFGRGTKL